jgi:hypothetical protein
MLYLPNYAYVFSSTILEIRAKQVLPGSDGWEGRAWGKGTAWRNDPNNICT